MSISQLENKIKSLQTEIERLGLKMRQNIIRRLREQ